MKVESKKITKKMRIEIEFLSVLTEALWREMNFYLNKLDKESK